MVKKISKRHILTFFIVFVIITALASPSEYIDGTLRAFILYAKNVLPALFPFIFFNKLLTMIGGANDLSVLLKKPLYRLYHAPAITGYVMIMSIFCGYPIGSKLTRDLYDNGVINRDECTIISILSSICGPIFIIGTVSQLLGSTKYGYIIYFSHLIATLLNGLIFKPKANKQSTAVLSDNINYDDLLGKSMTDSILSILVVGGYIAIMSFFITFVDKIHLTNCITTMFGYIGVEEQLSTAVWYGIFEMTRGIANLSICNLPPIFSVSIATFIVTFGGMCIALQSLGYTSKCGVKASKYFLAKLSQAIIATIISIIITLISF